MKKGQPVLLMLIIGSFVILSCAPMHRVVKTKATKDDLGNVNYLYGVTYNNTVIPEYTETAAGPYAGSYDEAWDLFEKRVDQIDPWIGDKYRLTNPTWFQLSNLISRLGLIAVSPLVVPVEWIGEKLFPDPYLGGPRSFKKIAEDFFETQYDQPVLKITEPVDLESAS